MNAHVPRYERLVHGGGGAHTRLLCGAVEFDHPGAAALTRLLPSIIHVSEWPESHRAWFDASITLMSHEAATARPGSETIMTRLADVFVVQAIRSWIVSNPDALTGWLRGLRDPRLGRALLAMHESPGDDWTVTSLARVCGMSRSGFSAAFKEVVGESPARHLAGWRMQLAHARLRDEDVSLAELAEDLGYASQAAFSRAFKRHTGQNPSEVR